MSALLGQKQYAEYVYDFSVSGGAVGVIALSSLNGKNVIPVDAVVKDVWMKVLTTCTSGGSATVEIGNLTDDNGYLTSIAVASLTAGSTFNAGQQAGALLWDNTNDAPLYANVANANDGAVNVKIGTAALTAGKFAVVVEYYSPSVNS